MKNLAILAVFAASCAAAHADPISVSTPKAPMTDADVAAYVSKRDLAVKTVCYEAVAPVVGLAHYSYLDCLKRTRAEVAKQDPTGLYAARDSASSMVVASK